MAAGFEVLAKMMQFYNNYRLEAEIAEFAAESSFIGAMEAGITLAPPVAVFAAMLYGVASDDEQVRELVKNENLRTGNTQGSIMGMLGWKWSQVDERFFRHYTLQIYQRQELNDIRVLNYNVGLRMGYHYAGALSPSQRKGCLAACRKFSGAKPGAWTERDQINYVIDMAVAFQRIYMPFS